MGLMNCNLRRERPRASESLPIPSAAERPQCRSSADGRVGHRRPRRAHGPGVSESLRPVGGLRLVVWPSSPFLDVSACTLASGFVRSIL